jgi:hypothetical protein
MKIYEKRFFGRRFLFLFGINRGDKRNNNKNPSKGGANLCLWEIRKKGIRFWPLP